MNTALASHNAYDLALYIGRFQPFHIAHQETLQIALATAERVLLIIGSAQDERTIKNPFSFAEREQMILQSLPQLQCERVHCAPMVDLYNDEKWTNAVIACVARHSEAGDRIALVGHFKDESSYYLRLFPMWSLVEVAELKNAISATPLRAAYFQTGAISTAYFPANVQQFLADFAQTTYYRQLRAKFLEQDKSPI